MNIKVARFELERSQPTVALPINGEVGPGETREFEVGHGSERHLALDSLTVAERCREYFLVLECPTDIGPGAKGRLVVRNVSDKPQTFFGSLVGQFIHVEVKREKTP